MRDRLSPRPSISRRKIVQAAAATIASAALPRSAWSTTRFPDRPITLLVGFAPGGGVDSAGRVFAKHVKDQFLATANANAMVVVNRTGAAGMLAASAVKSAAPDGYTLCLGSMGSLLASYTAEPGNRMVDPLNDFEMLGTIVDLVPGLMVSTDGPYKTLADLAEALRAASGKARWAHPGRGSIFYYCGLAFLKNSKATARDVPFRGGSEARTALIGNQVSFFSSGVSVVEGFEKEIKALAVSGQTRDKVFAHVPTFTEAGFPGVTLTNPLVLLAPKGTPADIVATLREAVAATVRSEGCIDDLRRAGLGANYETAEAVGARLASMRSEIENLALDSKKPTN